MTQVTLCGERAGPTIEGKYDFICPASVRGRSVRREYCGEYWKNSVFVSSPVRIFRAPRFDWPKSALTLC